MPNYPYLYSSIGLLFEFAGDEENQYEHSRHNRIGDITKHLIESHAISEDKDGKLTRVEGMDKVEAAIDDFISQEEIIDSVKTPNPADDTISWTLPLNTQTLSIILRP